MRTLPRFSSFLAATLIAALASAAPVLTKNGVSVDLSIEDGADGLVAVARYTPQPQKKPLHLYSKDLKEGGTGFPTRLELAPDQALKATGPVTADLEPIAAHDTEIYPPGPVTLRLPFQPTDDAGPDTVARFLVTYMACTDESCLVPVVRRPVAITLAGEPAPTEAPTAAAPAPAAPTKTIDDATIETIADTVARKVAAERTSAIHWRKPASAAELQKLIDEARDSGRIALLDFTGPSCVNCQTMAKSVFLLPEVRDAWNRGFPIEVDTDPPHDDLAAFQQERFETQNRPLYVSIAPDGHVEKWNAVFEPSDRAQVQRLVAFLEGGPGSDAGTGDGSLWSFLLLAVLGGLFTLVMPCTYPMIPFTINIFAKQSEAGRPLLPLASTYAFGIIAAFTGLGVIVTGLFGMSLSTLSGHPVTNLVVALMFIVLGLSLLEVFEVRLPGAFTNAVGGAKTGYLGALFMGLAFAVTGFTCTAPFAGSVLAQGVASGHWLMPIVGMVVYSGTIALPFFAMGIAPDVIKKLPRYGEIAAPMHEFKVIGGLVEIGAAAKFLAICDVAWGWGVFRRGQVLSLWAAIAFIIALYLTGRIRTRDDAEIQRLSLQRLLFIVGVVTLGLWLLHGLSGGHLGVVESFFPADDAPALG